MPRLTARSLKCTLVLNPLEVMLIGEPQVPRVLLHIQLADGSRTVTAEITAKSVRKALATPDGSILLRDSDFLTETVDFVMHELTHHRQAALIRQHGYKKIRGDHRDAGWYRAIAEAAPRYLGVRMPESVWPMQRPKPGRLTEVEATHWPQMFRPLIAAGDPRLQRISQSSTADFVSEAAE